MKMPKKYCRNSWLAIILIVFGSCEQQNISISHGNLVIEITNDLFTSINSSDEKAKKLTNFQPSEYLITDQQELTEFHLKTYRQEQFSDPAGKGVQYFFVGINEDNQIEKQLLIKAYDDFPDMIVTKILYINKSENDVIYKSWINNAYQVVSQQDNPPFWAFQGSSTSERADWIKPVSQDYFQENYMGMNSSDYGGGIPVSDIWRKDLGLTVGHVELVPKLISLPTEMKKYSDYVQVSVRKDFEYPTYLFSGDTLETLETFVSLHEGDYYHGLQNYSKFMQAKGIKMPQAEPQTFEPIWCAWGYERDFTLEEVTGTLSKVKELGIKWAVLDDGFQQAEGDWHTNSTKFPKGDNQIKELVDKIHGVGLKAKLWWAPLAADPGSRLLKENPDMRLQLADGAPQYITWWDAYYLSPLHPKTLNHTQEVVGLFLHDWNFDGLKMDGQHMNAVAPDHNSHAQMNDPEDASERLPEFYNLIYKTAKKIKPNAVVENCPCGTCMSFFNMPYMNQAVSSDPTSSWQIRLKGKTYKALIPNTAYYGDHVELSDNGSDFASSFGVGAVLGTKFTWPKNNPTASGDFLLTPEKEISWKKWFSLYNRKMLSKEKYLGNLYDIGYDKPETHVIQKGDTLNYAFYAPEWSGKLELRGLEDGYYIVNDYWNGTKLGEVSFKSPLIETSFKDFLLLEVYKK